MRWLLKAEAALLLAFLATATVALAPALVAETTPQMRVRLFAEARQRHPDVWDGCDQACVDARLAAEPFLAGLARQANVSLDDLARYSIVRAYEWGQNFERLYQRPPSIYDWTNAYTSNAEQLRYELAASPVIFAVDNWAERREYRLKQEYGGPY